MLKLREKRGITLVALVITIIILLILAGITISQLNDNGLFEKVKLSKEKNDEAKELEDSILSEYENQIGIYTGSNNVDEDNTIKEGIIADGSWNQTKKVNTPKLKGTGLIAIYYDNNGNMVELTKDSSEEAWNKWYDYNSNSGTASNESHWANAITKGKDAKGNEIITGYWVWIPRYAYQIDSELGNGGENVSGTINIKFLKGTTNKDENDIDRNEAYSINTTSKKMNNYVVHPAFKDGRKTDEQKKAGQVDYENGEWDAEIPGFWVAKYEAGFQECTQTISNGIVTEPTTDTSKIVYSNKSFISINTDYTTNAISQNLTEENYASQKISYPVFRPLTYSYNLISVSDMNTISKQIQDTKTFYNLNNVDSHMLKNSEWGAVIYLTQSNYGRNKAEVAQNKKNLNNKDSKNIYGVTGYAGEIANGVNASSTGNITGVFDLNGGAYESTSGYIINSQYTTNNSSYGTSFAMSLEDTKYATIYSCSSTDTFESNYIEYSKLKTTRYGDAILEISFSGSSGQNSWNKHYSAYPTSANPFFFRGGYYGHGYGESGIFCFSCQNGKSSILSGFRVALINN